MKHPRSSPIALLVVAILVAGIAASRADDPAPTRAEPSAGASTAEPIPISTPAAAERPDAVLVPAASTTEGGPRARPVNAAEPPARLGDPRLDPRTNRYVARLGSGRAVLTLDAELQERLERSLEAYRVPWGATVLIEPATGRVVALAEYSLAQPNRHGIALSAFAPAASIFKIVTAAALLEKGVGVDGEVCYHGGKRRLQPALLRDDPRRDRRCLSLTSAFGRSANVVFAKLADRDLDPETLRATAERFLFNVPIAFPRPVEISTAEIPDDPFDAANTAAGFGSVKLTPLHAALLAAIVANGGMFVPPVLVDATEGVASPAPPAPWRILDEQVAAQIREMMRETVVAGTARRAFRRVAEPLRGVNVAGKTGSLADPSPFRDYSWFIGFAPADKPQVAVATVIVNDRLWHARAPRVAKEALEAFFARRSPGSGVRTAAAR